MIAAGSVVAVAARSFHSLAKDRLPRILVLAGQGVAGDCHRGTTVQHRSRLARDPSQPNLRQVHLIQSELFEELHGKGFAVAAGQLGENITTRSIDLLALPTGTRLRLGTEALIEITGLRNPCPQIDAFQGGLQAALIERRADGAMIRKAGVMAVVLSSGAIGPGDRIQVSLPPQPHRRLEPV
jgi:MOSC domain-containing protein YiiM